jgi:hypothetical protein
VDKQTTGEEGKGERKQTPEEVDEESKPTMPISKEGTEINIGKILKNIFELSEDDNDDDVVSSQEGYSKTKRPNKGPRKHQLVNSLKNLEEHKKLLQDKSEMLFNTEVALTRTQGDKDKLTREIRVVATENRRITDLVSELAEKEKSNRRKAESDKDKIVTQLEKSSKENELLKKEVEELRRFKQQQEKESQRKEDELIETQRRQAKSSSKIKPPSGQFPSYYVSQTEK